MQVKLFEVRDAATFIPAIGVWIDSVEEKDEVKYLLESTGYFGRPYLLFGRLEDTALRYDSNRQTSHTMEQAHEYVENNWMSLSDGAVIDIEHINGDRPTPKIPQRLSERT